MSSDPSPLTLESLRQYVSGQMQLLIQLSDKAPPRFKFVEGSSAEDWEVLRREVWGKGPNHLDTTEEVQRGPGAIIDDPGILPDGVPSRCDAMLKPEVLEDCWSTNCAKIFIRPEYKEAEEFALSTCGATIPYNAFVVSGQPGIGKSIFLLRILLRRLSLGLPTALQLEPDHAILFYDGGVREFADLKHGNAYIRLAPKDQPLSRIWALVDSNKELTVPAPIFTNGPFFVVHVAPPRPTQDKWTRNVRTKLFYMKPWSFPEVLQARFLITPTPPSEEQLWDLHFQYGASLRSLFVFADRPDAYRREVLSEICELSPERLNNLLRSANNAIEGPLLVSTGPSPRDRTKPEGAFASQYVLEECCERILKGEVEQMKTMFDMLYEQPDSSTITGMLFEHRAHRFLREGRVLNLFPILASTTPENGSYVYKDYTATQNQRNENQITLPWLKECIVTKETTVTNEFNAYYRPRSANFPAISSWVLHQPKPYGSNTLLTFQMTMDPEKHDVKKVGLDMVDKLVYGDPRKYLVIFTPRGVEPHITVPTEYLIKFLYYGQYGHDVNKAFPMFHCPIDMFTLFSKPTSPR